MQYQASLTSTRRRPTAESRSSRTRFHVTVPEPQNALPWSGGRYKQTEDPKWQRNTVKQSLYPILTTKRNQHRHNATQTESTLPPLIIFKQ